MTFFLKIIPLRDDVEKYGRDIQVTEDNIIRRMRFVWCLAKVTDTLRICDKFLYALQQWLRHAPKYYVYAHIACLVYYKHISFNKLKRPIFKLDATSLFRIFPLLYLLLKLPFVTTQCEELGTSYINSKISSRILNTPCMCIYN